MRNRSRFSTILAITVVLFTGATRYTALGATVRQTGPVTFYHAIPISVDTLDPQLTGGGGSTTVIENIFLGLSNAHPVSMVNSPELAVNWTTHEHGRVWIFTLRDDIPWVRWDPIAGEAESVRMVTAYDVAYGIQRACDPRLAAFANIYISQLVVGCDALAARPLDQVTEEDYALVAAQALDDTTLRVELKHAAGYFLSMTVIPVFFPVPREIIEEFGEDWTQPGTILTNGPFLLNEVVPGVRYDLIRNPFFPADLRGPGNVERVVIGLTDPNDTLTLYRANQIDCGTALGDDAMHLDAEELVLQLMPTVHYLGFTYDKPPFDNMHVRRAFSAAFDSARFVAGLPPNKLRIPMIHFTPPANFGAPPIDEVGVGYAPDYARQQLALGGYPDCAGFPEFRVVVVPGTRDWGEFLADSIQDTLGCQADLVRIEETEFGDLLSLIDPNSPYEDRPEMWQLHWAPDYPDANNWVGDVLSCDSDNSFIRPCSEVDDLIWQAAAETDPATRSALYYDIEDRFFGPEGEHPMIPLYMQGWDLMVKPWLDGPFATDGIGFWVGLHYDWYTIDQAAQLAARGK